MHRHVSPAVLLLAAIALPSLAYGQDDKEAGRRPAKGDTIVAIGCLRGSALESQETRRDGAEGTVFEPITYRLTGDKALLRDLKAKHSKHLIEVTGVLKSRFPDRNAPPGAQIGKTGIYVGIAAPGASRPPALPNLQVTGFKPLDAECGR